jgi:hypothetical protein
MENIKSPKELGQAKLQIHEYAMKHWWGTLQAQRSWVKLNYKSMNMPQNIDREQYKPKGVGSGQITNAWICHETLMGNITSTKELGQGKLQIHEYATKYWWRILQAQRSWARLNYKSMNMPWNTEREHYKPKGAGPG